MTEGLPAQPTRFDFIAIGLTALSLAAWTLYPQARIGGALLMAAGAAQFIRLARWSGLKTLREPLVLILHLSFFASRWGSR